jgi:hypothetical protein
MVKSAAESFVSLEGMIAEYSTTEGTIQKIEVHKRANTIA